MIPWMMPASEAKVISDDNRRVKRALGFVSQMIFERAKEGHSFLFFRIVDIEDSIIGSLDEDDRKAVSDILFDSGYMTIPIYDTNPRGREDIRKLRGYNIDWSGQYE